MSRNVARGCGCPPEVEDIRNCRSCSKLQLRHRILCLRSDRVWDTYWGHEAPDDEKLGSISGPSNHPHCPFCCFLTRVKSRYQEAPLDDNSAPDEWIISLPYWHHKSLGGSSDEIKSTECFYLIARPYGRKLINYPGLVNVRPRFEKDKPAGKFPPPIRKVGPHVNWGVVNSYLRTCEENHAKKCKGPADSDNFRKPRRVIDVRDECLVDTPGRCAYLTLSYVWGRFELEMEMPTAKKSNISMLRRKRALSRVHVPATIRDAIYACRRLGHRYLWVDSLCIVQDDNSELADQMNHMYDIYSGSYLTIIAPSGDHANAGLPGVGKDNQRALQRGTLYQGMEIIEVLPLLHDVLEHCIWSTRAWTQQEELLSRRRLYFTPFQVYLMCETAVFNEDICVAAHGKFGKEKFGHTPGRPYHHPPWDKFEEQLINYTRRNLSFPSDIFNAFSGIHQHLFGSVRSIFGLPESHFVQALIWQPDRVYRRRLPDKTRDIIIPSWSWASCEGTVRPYHIWWGKINQCVADWWVCISEDEGFEQVDAGIDVLRRDNFLQSPACVPKPGRLFVRTKLALLNLRIEELSEAKLFVISPLKANRKKRPSMRYSGTEWDSIERFLDPTVSYDDTETNLLEVIVGHINVDPTWLTVNMERLNTPTSTTDPGYEFIAIVHKTYHPYTKEELKIDDQVYIMLIESQGDVARRVGVTNIPIIDWAELRPVCKDIILE